MIKVLDNFGKTADRFTLIIDEDLWFMSADANMPNGVCMYGGTIAEYDTQDLGVEVELDELPQGTNKQLTNVLLNYCKA